MPSTPIRRAFNSQSPSPPPSFGSPTTSNRNVTATATAPEAANEDEQEDDYMNMTIEEPKKGRESLVEKQRRKQRESEIRGRPKSKAELAQIEKEKREEALAKSLIDAEAERSNKGLRMMKMMGYKAGTGLGKQQPTPPPPLHSSSKQEDKLDGGAKEGSPAITTTTMTWERTDVRLEPIGLALKEDRAGIGHTTELKRKLEESSLGADGEPAKKQQLDPEEYRARVREEREERRKEAQFYAAQKVCEKFDLERDYGVAETEEGENKIGAQREGLLKNVNVLWRGMVRHREQMELQRRMRHDMEQGLDAPRLPGYDKVHELDDEDKVALGMEAPALRSKEHVVEVDPEEEEDQELAEFEALGADEKLDRAVKYLRKEYNYCFWCKYQYEDEEMDGCPGLEEDMHG